MALIGQPTLASIGSVKVGFVTFDVSESESHDVSAEPTMHPIEEGADVSDHIKQLPDTLSITGIVTNTPIGFISLADTTRAMTAYDNLLFMKEEGDLLDVVTDIRDYENMVIKRISLPRSAQAGDAITVTVELQRARVVASQTVGAPQPRKPTAKPTKNRGKKPTSDATQAQSGANKSVLARWADGG